MKVIRSRLKKIPLRERVSLLYGDGNWKIHGIPSSKIPGLTMHDGPLGLRVSSAEGLIDGIAESKPATCYPSPALMACSFDVELLKEQGEMMAYECSLAKTNLLLAPGINIKRNPLCGRNFEYYSEDPYLSGKLAASFVKGIQKKKIGACVKHFCCNSQETYRMVNDSIVDARALREIYLKAFEIVVNEANPAAIMASYNKINGVYACDNKSLLLDLLKGQWRYGGVVMSDWGGTSDYILSHNNGLDIEMPGIIDRKKDLIKAVKRGILDLDRVNDSAQRVTALLQKFGGDTPSIPAPKVNPHEFARRAAEESMVLLQNDGILPLKSYRDVAVIGTLAETPRFQGLGSSRINARPISFLEAVGNGVAYAAGYSLDDSPRDDLRLEAIDLASKSKKVLLFLGLPESYESEGFDRQNMCLPENQIRLFDALYKVNQNIVVVLSCGAPVELPFKSSAKAILLTYLAGEAFGEAVDRVIRGEVNPSGKLAESWPIHLSYVPSFGFYPGSQMQSVYRESIYVGYRYYLTANVPVNFPFGHGLSYSKFKFGKPILSSPELSNGKTVKVDVEVSNVSKRDGATVVQLYSEPPKAAVFKALRTLIGFTKVKLKAGETKVVSFELGLNDFAHFDTSSRSFRAEGGNYLLEVGDSSSDIKTKSILKVISDYTFQSQKQMAPAYYLVTREGFMQYENDFEFLLGRPVKLAIDPRTPPYNPNSTIGDISDTWIGKKIIKKAFATIDTNPNSPNRKMMERSIYEMPLRNLSMAGMGPNRIKAIVLLANKKFVRGIATLIFKGNR